MNNSVKDGYGNVVGFRCWRCGEVFQSMWGVTCNRCRHNDEENAKLRAEIQKLTEALKPKKKMTAKSDVKEKGLMVRYRVTKLDGTTNPDAEYFVLRLDDKGSDPIHIAACRAAINTYAEAIKSHLPKLHDDLKRLYGSYASERTKELESEIIDFAIWYSGMQRREVESAYQRFLKERDKDDRLPGCL